ncbi:solute carrier family 2, facilitated glucose transporter member 11-like [Zootoca vivipara]|uniref:solute carrier family 2, facilitated glucose transporter member 11-like n=1 Tax=Zootoca vivipara TaxID=8524 RepID=UPI00293BB6E5|nr:solute carrier family 2, facilitated glucose transporter member 11-like [Zootoca vivipara]
MANLCSNLVLYRKMFLMAIVLGLGGTFFFGFQVSMINFTSPFVKKFINDTWLERYNTPIDDQSLMLLWSFTVSIFSIGGLTGTCLSGYLSAKCGKKNCIIFSSLFMLVAAVIMGTSKIANSFEMILLGRLLYGFNAGLGVCIQGQYLAEISPKHLRGLTNVTIAVLANLGKFLGQLTGLHELLGTESLWPLLLASGGFLALLLLITAPFFPESPSYLLIQKGDLEGCLKSLKQLWGEGDHRAEVGDLLKEQAATKEAKIMSVLELFRDRSMRCQVYLLIMVASTLPFSGVSAIYFYSFDVFRTAGFNEELSPYVTLGVGACELCSTIVCFFIIERAGRRTLLLWGYGLMIVALALLTTTLSLQDRTFWLPYCNVALIFLYIVIYGVGPSGTTFPVIAELFTQSSRPAALVIGTTLHWVELYLIGMLFPYLVSHLGNFCFIVFMGIMTISWVFIFRFLPETKGMSLMDIQMEFNHLKMGKNQPEYLEKCTKL